MEETPKKHIYFYIHKFYGHKKNGSINAAKY